VRKPSAVIGSHSARLHRAASEPVVDETMKSNETPDHQHTPEEEREIREAALDRTIEGSFPASDPSSSNPNPDDHDALREASPLHGGDKIS
jgi:hypothetical protein